MVRSLAPQEVERANDGAPLHAVIDSPRGRGVPDAPRL